MLPDLGRPRRVTDERQQMQLIEHLTTTDEFLLYHASGLVLVVLPAQARLGFLLKPEAKWGRTGTGPRRLKIIDRNVTTKRRGNLSSAESRRPAFRKKACVLSSNSGSYLSSSDCRKEISRPSLSFRITPEGPRHGDPRQPPSKRRPNVRQLRIFTDTGRRVAVR